MCTLSKGYQRNYTKKRWSLLICFSYVSKYVAKRNSDYITSQSYNFVECLECEWIEMQIRNKHLQEFIFTTLRRPFYRVKTIHSFGEMFPIFKNVEISRNDIREYMKSYAEKKWHHGPTSTQFYWKLFWWALNWIYLYKLDFFVYQYAKLCMLQFSYDFLDNYIR